MNEGKRGIQLALRFKYPRRFFWGEVHFSGLKPIPLCQSKWINTQEVMLGIIEGRVNRVLPPVI